MQLRCAERAGVADHRGLGAHEAAGVVVVNHGGVRRVVDYPDLAVALRGGNLITSSGMLKALPVARSSSSATPRPRHARRTP